MQNAFRKVSTDSDPYRVQSHCRSALNIFLLYKRVFLALKKTLYVETNELIVKQNVGT